VALHALLHMAERRSAITSESLARLLHTNPVVVRRTMAGLRLKGIVRSEKGHGGGWTLVQNLDALTLGDVYDAIGNPEVFAMGNRVESPGCAVEKAVNRAMDAALGEAEALLVKRLRSVSLADVAADVQRQSRSPRGQKGETHHV
jgi:DNA-binding IscR family transcriptional regulator